ncbi:hypothetical protein L9F63_008488, partial [Diploptera punctata]
RRIPGEQILRRHFLCQVSLSDLLNNFVNKRRIIACVLGIPMSLLRVICRHFKVAFVSMRIILSLISHHHHHHLHSWIRSGFCVIMIPSTFSIRSILSSEIVLKFELFL